MGVMTLTKVNVVDLNPNQQRSGKIPINVSTIANIIELETFINADKNKFILIMLFIML
jgi:hypothetical protein